MVVNVYIYQTIKGPGKKNGAYTYILETEVDGKEYTITDTGLLKDMTENKAELTTLLKALKRLRRECDLMIFTESQHVKTGIEEWMDKWIHDNWKNARGKNIANIEEWQQVKEFKDNHEMHVIYCSDNGYMHTYEKWMISESEKKDKENSENEKRKA